jgi:hypothetical protein
MAFGHLHALSSRPGSRVSTSTSAPALDPRRRARSSGSRRRCPSGGLAIAEREELLTRSGTSPRRHVDRAVRAAALRSRATSAIVAATCGARREEHRGVDEAGSDRRATTTPPHAAV